MDLYLEGIGRDGLNWVFSELHGQSLKRAVLGNTKNCHTWSLQFLNRLNNLQFSLHNFIHPFFDLFTFSLPLIVKFHPIDVESQGRVTIDTDIFVDLFLFGHINSRNDVFRFCSFHLFSKSLVDWCELNAMAASWRVVFNKNIGVVFESGIVVVIGQLKDMVVLYFLLLTSLFVLFGLLSIMEFLYLASIDILDKLSQGLFLVK